MKNRHVRDRLSEYIDGMLSEKEASAVKEHMNRCPDCLEEYKEMLKIIGYMNQMEGLGIPDSFVEKVHERMEKKSSLRGLLKGLFIPIKIKVPLELAGVAAAALLVIYIVGIRGKQHVYELAYVQRSQAPAVLQEQTPETETFVDEAIAVIDEAAPQKKKEEPELKFEVEKGEKRDKRSGPKKAIPEDKKDAAAFEPTETGIKKQVQAEAAVPSSKTVKEGIEREFEPHEERLERKSQNIADAPPGVAKISGVAEDQKKEELSPEMADNEKAEIELDARAELEYREKNIEEIIVAMGGKIIEFNYNKDSKLLESLLIEIPAAEYQKLIQILEKRGDIRIPYPAVKEKEKEIIRVRLKFQH